MDTLIVQRTNAKDGGAARLPPPSPTPRCTPVTDHDKHHQAYVDNGDKP